MRRQFTLQLYPRPPAHKHWCEACLDENYPDPNILVVDFTTALHHEITLTQNYARVGFIGPQTLPADLTLRVASSLDGPYNVAQWPSDVHWIAKWEPRAAIDLCPALITLHVDAHGKWFGWYRA